MVGSPKIYLVCYCLLNLVSAALLLTSLCYESWYTVSTVRIFNTTELREYRVGGRFTGQISIGLFYVYKVFDHGFSARTQLLAVTDTFGPAAPYYNDDIWYSLVIFVFLCETLLLLGISAVVIELLSGGPWLRCHSEMDPPCCNPTVYLLADVLAGVVALLGAFLFSINLFTLQTTVLSASEIRSGWHLADGVSYGASFYLYLCSVLFISAACLCYLPPLRSAASRLLHNVRGRNSFQSVTPESMQF